MGIKTGRSGRGFGRGHAFDVLNGDVGGGELTSLVTNPYPAQWLCTCHESGALLTHGGPSDDHHQMALNFAVPQLRITGR